MKPNQQNKELPNFYTDCPDHSEGMKLGNFCLACNNTGVVKANVIVQNRLNQERLKAKREVLEKLKEHTSTANVDWMAPGDWIRAEYIEAELDSLVKDTNAD